MQTLTIIVEDNQVYVDGAPRTVDCSKLTFHALQWDDTAKAGHIEYASTVCPTCKCTSRKPNDPISDVTAYQSYIDRWTAVAQQTSEQSATNVAT